MFDKIKDMNNNAPKPLSPSVPTASRASSTQDDSGSMTSISSSVTVVGKISGEGTVKIFGKVEGEIDASTVFVCADAQVDEISTRRI